MAEGITKISSLVDPEVMAELIRQKLADSIKFSALAEIDVTLAGRPGDEITLPKYAYIGDAADVAEGASIPVEMLTATTAKAKVKKAAKGVALTDEAVLGGYGDPVGEAVSQLGLAIAQKVDNDCAAALAGIKTAMTVDKSTESVLTAAVIADALVKFGEDLDAPKVLLIAPAQLAQIRKDSDYINASELATGMLMAGSLGMIWGCEVQLSNKVKEQGGKYTNYIVSPGALAVYLKRDVLVETDRDIRTKTTTITADQHYTAYLKDESKAVKLVVAATQPAPTA